MYETSVDNNVYLLKIAFSFVSLATKTVKSSARKLRQIFNFLERLSNICLSHTPCLFFCLFIDNSQHAHMELHPSDCFGVSYTSFRRRAQLKTSDKHFYFLECLNNIL